MQGMVHVYTGKGKGKTTAAFGLAIRAVGAGKNVYIAQFVKGMKYSELKSLKKIERIEIKQYGLNCFIKGKAEEEDINAARKGLEEVAKILKSGEYELVILDEANIAVYYDLFSEEQLIEAIDNRSEEVEVVITGRYAADKIIEYADLVTEMKEIKHYYQKGVKARIGIEK
ncbi:MULTISPECIES: cob(I)yrinic acid a,c-diamide adenosyltransferase [unclassified Halanaerobium]|jgi:cob(I)alamin adenosyltransferase|uniref:cob(I)yrinic acid a,c-diamide adenosyltransferase n=1 Tax=unclassified Halanaerobium TaxID=2641197 RepID=UPI000DF3FA31|nr:MULTISPECIES: cob(I)yrinic acid a,c-diamide adenosyltransferase [unclassified Halanaerobium]RCW50432.1 cob(I)alamin adenosyltransferase [Halanaerobium sp. MA284_MarDTE_T2]RCW84223.1 cob(I)alamin adenosyltransferase [Halanaerobium sp. DL-01]